MIREVSQRTSSNVVVIIPITHVKPLGRLARWIGNRRSAADSPWVDHADETLRVVDAPPAGISAVVADERCDVIVDLAGGGADESIGQPGVATYQLWCGEARTAVDFRCLAIAPIRSRHRIVWTRHRGTEPPRIAAESSVLLTSPDHLPDQELALLRAIALLLRALERRSRGPTIGTTWTIPARAATDGTIDAVRGAVRSQYRIWRGRLRRRWARDDVWFLGYRVLSPTEVDAPTPPYEKWGADQSAFVADPFTLVHKGTEYVFFEDFQYSIGRGVIAWSVLQDDGSLSSPRIALERPYHLSYPFVVEHDGEVYMIPETASNGTVELYRAVNFPHEWELHRTLLEGVKAVDATLHFDGSWWMFVNIGECDSSTWDELFLFKADRIEGPWRAHPLNPVKCDPSSTRPAGRMFVEDGKLIRPSQDCSTVYGRAVTLSVVDELTDESFAESEYERIEPTIVPGAVAVHTVARSGRLDVIDAMWTHKPRWWRGYPR